VDEGSGGGEADCKALLAGGKTQAQREVGFAGAGRSSDILPGVKKAFPPNSCARVPPVQRYRMG
jgi:hypothetical protein